MPVILGKRAFHRRLALPLVALIFLSACARHEFTGTVFEEIEPAAPIPGRNYDGAAFDLADLKGYPVLLFFGYTFCPDICPLTMLELAKTKRMLAEDAPAVAADLQLVFVSIDPRRDSLARLKPYVLAFHPRFFGVQLSEAGIAALKPAYGLYADVAEGQSLENDAYLLDHTSGVYLVDREGNWRALFRGDVSAEELAADLKALLQ